VDLRARLRPNVTPVEVEEQIKQALETPLRGSPRITLEELDGDEVVVRISATPQNSADGSRLATEVLRAISPQVRGRDRVEAMVDGPRSEDERGRARE